MIKVTLEFHSVPEAIIALNAVMNLPEVKATAVAATPGEKVAEAKSRRARADKGQKRGEYKPRTEPAAGAAQVSAVPASATSPEAVQTRSEAKPGESTPSAPTTAAPTATIGEKDAEAQKAMELLHAKKGLDACRVLLGQFGVSRIREIPTARRAEFLEEAGKAAV